MRSLLLFMLSAPVIGCGGAARSPGLSPPSAPASAASVLRDLDALASRVDRLAPDAYAIPAGLGCAAGCDVLGVKGITIRPDFVSCVCNRLPKLGVHRVPSSSKPAKERAPEERVGSLNSQVFVDEDLGAVAIEDGGRAGLSPAGGTP